MHWTGTWPLSNLVNYFHTASEWYLPVQQS
jgi:hypothetical protein